MISFNRIINKRYNTRCIMKIEEKNTASLEVIENALFIICLDKNTPQTTGQKSREYWHGDQRNRFMDKSLQFIINDNGKMGYLLSLEPVII